MRSPFVWKAIAKQFARQDLSVHVNLVAKPSKGCVPDFYVGHETGLIASGDSYVRSTAEWLSYATPGPEAPYGTLGSAAFNSRDVC